MTRFRSFGVILLFAIACLLPMGAWASTKCLCNNGVVTEAMDDDEDACDDACDLFGGGRTWTPEDANDDAEVDEVDGVRREEGAERRYESHPARPR